ncbi:MAG: glycosyltransferase family 2 protein [Flavobacteriales bacterium]|nr:glycosyltransferase family 2 protein [Flavobacteriales bacterium]
MLKVSGFTFIRNAICYDYPVVEAISSILPVCDEVVVAVGKSEDDTLDLVRSIHPDKVRVVETTWDDSLRKGGAVLAVETNKALAAVAPDADWAFYIQADEVLHEQYVPGLKKVMETWKDDKRVEGLVFDYRHFYGSYDYIGDSRRWYRREVRVVRPAQGIYSFRDAQGFQKDGRPLKVKHADAVIHHYGWVRPPDKQQERQVAFHSLWHDDAWVDENVRVYDQFDYSGIDSLTRYEGTHPAVMLDRISRMNWQFSFDPSQKKLSMKSRILQWVFRLTGWRIGEYRNYRVI